MAASPTDHLPVDSWVWGSERLVWGFDPQHEYTCKILEPKAGRQGCLSLQYHDLKSESWVVLRGIVWALIISNNKLSTRIMRAGDVQNLPAGTIHRLMGLSTDAQVVEASTPDRHAADKSIVKDVKRLHCVFGRPLDAPRSELEKSLVAQAMQATEEAIVAFENGTLPVVIG